jgi:hypothetical protein
MSDRNDRMARLDCNACTESARKSENARKECSTESDAWEGVSDRTGEV